MSGLNITVRTAAEPYARGDKITTRAGGPGRVVACWTAADGRLRVVVVPEETYVKFYGWDRVQHIQVYIPNPGMMIHGSVV